MFEDLKINITKGYKACGDKTFKKYITDILNRDKDNLDQDLLIKTIMIRVANKHKSMV